MSITTSDFNGKLEFLLKSVDDKTLTTSTDAKTRQAAATALSDCIKLIGEEETSLQEAFSKAHPDGIKDLTDLEKRYADVNQAIGLIEKISKSQLGQMIAEDTGATNPLWLIQHTQKKLSIAMETIDTVKALRQTNPAFAKAWGTLSADEREMTTERLFLCLDSCIKFDLTIKDDKRARQSALDGILLILTQHIALLPKELEGYDVVRIFQSYVDNFTTAKARAEQILQHCFEIISAVKPDMRKNTRKAVIRIFHATDSIDKLETAMKSFKLFSAMDEFDPKVIDATTFPLLNLGAKDPVSFRRFIALNAKRVDISSLLENIDKYLPHVKGGCMVLLDLTDNLPNDAPQVLNALFSHIFPISSGNKLPSPVIAKFEVFLNWINEQIAADPSLKTKEKMSSLLDRMVALLTDVPLTAASLLNLPKEKYGLLDKIFKGRIDIADLTENEAVDALKAEGEQALAAALFDNSVSLADRFNAVAVQSPLLEQTMHGFLDVALQLQAPPVQIVPNMSIQQKIQKLPSPYTSVIDRMLTAVGADGKALLEILTFARAYPYSKTLDVLLDSLSKQSISLAKDDLKGVALSGLNTLSLAFPNALPQILALDFKLIPLLMQLLQINKILTDFLIEKYSDWISEDKLKIAVKDPEVQSGLIILMETENKHNCSLLKLLTHNIDKIKEKPLLAAIVKDPEFGSCLSQASSSYTTWKEILDAFKAHPDETIRLVKALSLYPNALKKLLEQDPGKALDILTLEKSKHPADVGRIAYLMESDETKLAKELMELFKTDADLAHRLLDMAFAGYSQNVVELLKRHTDNPKDLLTQKLMQAAGSRQAPLIRKILQLDPKNDHVLLKMAAESHGKEISKLFEQMLILQARGEEELLKHAMEIYDTPVQQRSPASQVILAAVEDGRFNLAERLLTTDGKPYIQPGLLIPPLQTLQKWQEIFSDWLACNKKALTPQDRALIENDLVYFIAKYTQDRKNSHSFYQWGSKVQFLLQHNPQRLIQILKNPNWQKVDEGSTWDITADIAAVMNKLPAATDATSLTKLSITLANCLITPSGRINTGIIDSLKTHPAVQKFQDPYVADYIQRVLKTLSENTDFNDRLGKLEQIPFPSRQHQVIAKMLNHPADKPLNLREAKVAVISVLLWPLRQDLSSSCFATSTLIQLAGRPDGLKQIMEDSMSLVGNGCIQRKSTEPNQGSVEYPLIMDSEAASKRFAGDNLLARTLEYTVAAMGASQLVSLKDKAIKQWEKLIFPEIFYHYELSQAALRNEDVSSKAVQEKAREMAATAEIYTLSDNSPLKIVHTALLEQFKKSALLVFNGYATHSFENTTGAWLLLDMETGDPLENDGVLPKFYNKVLLGCKEPVLKAHAQHAPFIREMFDQILPKFLHSKAFNQKFLSKDTAQVSILAEPKKIKGLPFVNPVKYIHLRAETPLAQYGIGGWTRDMISVFHSDKIIERTARPSSNPFKSIFINTQFLSDDEMQQAASSPSFYKTVSSSSHAFNFRAAQALALFKNKGPAEIYDAQQKQLAEVEMTPLTPVIQDAIVKAFMDGFHAQNHPQLTHALKSKLPACKTIRDLCDALSWTYAQVRGTADASGLFADRVEKAIRTLPALKDKMPAIISVYDTNWAGDMPTFGYETRIYDRSTRRIFPAPEGQSEISGWNPGDADKIIHFQFRDSTNPYFRAYYQPR